MRLGILGGSFDPVHFGHLILAQSALEELTLDKIIFMPSYKPPHKLDKKLASFEDRLLMLELALEDREDFLISTLEMERQGPSYTYDSLKIIEKSYGASELYFLIGGDSLLYLDKWYRASDLIREFSFAVAPRPGRSIEELEEKIKSLQGNIKLLDSPYIEISSSSIRKRLEDYKSIRYYLPRSVEGYIHEKKLYR